jgi:hypothetical protein
LRPIKPSPVRGSHRDRNQRAIIVEHAVQRSLGRRDDSAAQGFEARGPLPFSAAMDRQRGFCIHWVNLADTRLARLIDRLGHYLSANFAFASRSLGSRQFISPQG